MKKLYIVVLLLLAAIPAFAGAYPNEMLQTIKALQADAELKKEMPATIEGLTIITPEEAHKLWKEKKLSFIDNRGKAQYETEKISGAEWIYTDDLLKDPSLSAKFDKAKTYALYCNGTHCWRSPAAGLMLKSLGFTHVYWLRDGMPGWKAKAYPTE